MPSHKRLVRISFVLLLLATMAFASGSLIEDRIDEFIVAELDAASAAVLPVIAELYPTPISGEFDPQFPPTPNIAAARARFGEGGELLPGGMKLCLRPDWSGSVLPEDEFEEDCPPEYR